MKVKLTANAELDLLTQQEVRSVVNEALIRHFQYGLRIKPVTVTATDPNLPGQMTLTCPKGYMWDVRSIYVVKSAADFVRLYTNNTATARHRSIADDGDNGNVATFTRGDVVVRGDQSLIVQAKTGGTTLVSVVTWVMEVPDGHDWHLK